MTEWLVALYTAFWVNIHRSGLLRLQRCPRRLPNEVEDEGGGGGEYLKSVSVCEPVHFIPSLHNAKCSLRCLPVPVVIYVFIYSVSPSLVARDILSAPSLQAVPVLQLHIVYCHSQ